MVPHGGRQLIVWEDVEGQGGAVRQQLPDQHAQGPGVARAAPLTLEAHK